MTTLAPPLTEIRCLSVRQPDAGAFFSTDPERIKFCDNRQYQTPYRGKIFIHASKFDKRPPPGAIPEVAYSLWDRPTGPQDVGAIIGSVELVDILTVDHLSVLRKVPLDAKEMDREAWRFLYPSERAGFLDRYAAIRPLVSKITDDQFEMHACGYFCWIVKDPQLLAQPIPTGGKLRLWKLQVPEDSLQVRS